jgi:hypothetical protein
MVHVDILDEWFDLESSLNLFFRHILGNFSWISGDTSNKAVAELFVLLSIVIVSEDDGFLSSIFTGVEDYDLSLFVNESSSVSHRFIKFIFLTI